MLQEACRKLAEEQAYVTMKEVEAARRGEDGAPAVDSGRISEETIQLANLGSLACFGKPLSEWIPELEAVTGEVFGRWRFTGLVLAGRRERALFEADMRQLAADIGAQLAEEQVDLGDVPALLPADQVESLANLGAQSAFGLSLAGLRRDLGLVNQPLTPDELLALAHLGQGRVCIPAIVNAKIAPS